MGRLTEDKKGLATDRERHMKSSKEVNPSRENRPRTEYKNEKRTEYKTAGQFGGKLCHEISPWCGVVLNWYWI